jgi:hypothetical protein
VPLCSGIAVFAQKVNFARIFTMFFEGQKATVKTE